jgi:hypothetical protein
VIRITLVPKIKNGIKPAITIINKKMKNQSLIKLISDLPIELKKEVEDYVLFIRERRIQEFQTNQFIFEWEGALDILGDHLSTMKLQDLAYQWWEEADVSR